MRSPTAPTSPTPSPRGASRFASRRGPRRGSPSDEGITFVLDSPLGEGMRIERGRGGGAGPSPFKKPPPPSPKVPDKKLRVDRRRAPRLRSLSAERQGRGATRGVWG